jgi:DNA invertase Pin-like site-specific DNA recombinase
MLAALYARISDDREQDEKGVRRQIKLERALVATRGGTIVMERIDNDISASKGKHRPGYEDIMAAAAAGLLTHIVVPHTSRLWRNRKERADGIERLKAAGVSVIAVKGPELDLSTAYGRGMADLVGAFDSMEGEVKGERVRWKVEELAEAGAIGNGGNRPYGYRRIFVGEGRHRKILRDEVDEVEAEIIREIAKRLLAGDTKNSVITWLNGEGIPTSTGGMWSAQGLHVLMRRARLAGFREHHDKITVKAVWPKIIERETHEQLRTLLDARQPPTGFPTGRQHYLTGSLFCDRCLAAGVGKNPGRMKVHSRQRGEQRYRCLPKNMGGCAGREINLMELEKLVDKYMVGRLGDPKTLRELAQRESTRKDNSRALVDRIEADERRLALLQAQMNAEDAPEDELPELVTSVRVIRRRMAQAREELSRVMDVPAVAGEALADLAVRWPSLSVDRKCSLLRTFVERIIIGPAKPGPIRFDPARVDIVPRKLGTIN